MRNLLADALAAPVRAGFQGLDRTRRLQGRAEDLMGLGPQRTPSTVVLSRPGVRLLAYPVGTPTGEGPPVLLVPAPIKRSYIWDLSPEVSIVRLLQLAGLRVFLVDWTTPGHGERDAGLEAYADSMLRVCAEAVLAAAGRPPVLVGHSLGGTQAAIFAALNPQLVRALVLLEAPLAFGGGRGPLGRSVSPGSSAREVRALLGDHLPGAFLTLVSAVGTAGRLQAARYVDLLASMGDPAALLTHLRVERWTADEFPFPGRLFEDVVEQLYRKDAFLTGELYVGGRRAGPDTLVAPLLNVVGERSEITSEASVLPFHVRAASASRELLRYRGDIGVGLQHVGTLVGRNARAEVWPRVLEWLSAIDEAPGAGVERAPGEAD